MLFDEPTSALDPELIGEVLAVMRDLAAARMTMIVVTHEMGFAREVANRMCFFHEGQLLEQGTPEEIFTRTQRAETRQFLDAVLSTGIAACRVSDGARVWAQGGLRLAAASPVTVQPPLPSWLDDRSRLARPAALLVLVGGHADAGEQQAGQRLAEQAGDLRVVEGHPGRADSEAECREVEAAVDEAGAELGLAVAAIVELSRSVAAITTNAASWPSACSIQTLKSSSRSEPARRGVSMSGQR